MRKLASIQQIMSIEPIDGADHIELAHVLGWQCVVNKGQFKSGDFAVYFETGSLLPVIPQFEFLRKTCLVSTPKGEGFRLKTQKFKGVISQGLLLPVKEFPKIPAVQEGEDLTQVLNIGKYEIEERDTNAGRIIGPRPCCIPLTEEIRIQAMPELLKEFAGLGYYITTKLDGSSHSIGIDEGTDSYYVSGRNYEYNSGPFYDFVAQREYGTKARAFAESENLKSLVIQGEFCGPSIQGNKLKLDAPEWYVFTVIENGKRAGQQRMIKVCRALGAEHVPIEEVGVNLPSFYPNVDALLERAEGEYPKGGRKEGIVIRPCKPVYSEIIRDYLSIKVVNNRFLLKNGE